MIQRSIVKVKVILKENTKIDENRYVFSRNGDMICVDKKEGIEWFTTSLEDAFKSINLDYIESYVISGPILINKN